MMPFSTEKISSMLGYRPIPDGTYMDGRIARVKMSWKEENERRRVAKQLRLVTRELAARIPEGSAFILVDGEEWGPGIVPDRKAIPFLEKDGQYWGEPEDDATAIRELERLRQKGASFLVFGWPSFWWIDFYPQLIRHLRSSSNCLLENRRLIVFDLRR